MILASNEWCGCAARMVVPELFIWLRDLPAATNVMLFEFTDCSTLF